MTLKAASFLAQYRSLRTRVEGAQVSDELRQAYERVVEAFRSTYTSESLKEALGSDAAVPNELEERLTSALILFNRERTAGASGVSVEP